MKSERELIALSKNAHAGSHRRTIPAAAESILKKAAKLGLSIKGREAKGK